MENLQKKTVKNTIQKSGKKKVSRKFRENYYIFEIIIFIFSCVSFFSPYNLYNYMRILLFQQNTITTVYGPNPNKINQKSLSNFFAFAYISNFIAITFLFVFMFIMIIKKRLKIGNIEKIILCSVLFLNIVIDTIIFFMNPKTIIIEDNVNPENISFVYPLILPFCTFLLAVLYFLAKEPLVKLYHENYKLLCEVKNKNKKKTKSSFLRKKYCNYFYKKKQK